MSLNALVVDLLRPSGAVHTIVVRAHAPRDSLVVADIADVAPPDSAEPVPVDAGSFRLQDADGMDVDLFQSRPRQFARRASSSLYDVQITPRGVPMRGGVYYLGLPPEWCVCSVEITDGIADRTPRPWTGLHSHADDSSWIGCAFSGAPASGESLSIRLSVDSDQARGVSPLPEFGVLHHRHSPIEIVRAAEGLPGAYGVRIDLKAVLRSSSRGDSLRP